MDNNEIAGRLLAVETLLAAIITKLPRATGEAILKTALPALQRQPSSIAAHSTKLAAEIQRRLPPAE